MRRPRLGKSNADPSQAAQPTSASTEYEVRCHDCDVSFPVGTRRCMYCGNRPGQRSLFSRELAPDPMIDFAPLGELPFDEVHTEPRPIDLEETEDEQPQGNPLFRILGNFSWIILFALITIYRSCAEE